VILKILIAVLVLGIVGVGAYLIGSSNAPTKTDATAARRAAFTQSFRAARVSAEEASRSRGRLAGRALGRRTGRDAGSAEGQQAGGSAASAASAPPPSTGGCPPGSDAFGDPSACIARPAPGVSPEYDSCIAEGGFPTPDGCTKP
jgi:hypothetical protein